MLAKKSNTHTHIHDFTSDNKKIRFYKKKKKSFFIEMISSDILLKDNKEKIYRISIPILNEPNNH